MNPLQPAHDHPLYPLYKQMSSAERQLVTFTDFLRMYAVEGLLRRIALLKEAEFLVLRGSLLTRQWVRPAIRPAEDIDFLTECPLETEFVISLLVPVCEMPFEEDGLAFELRTCDISPIWEYSDTPGIRAVLTCRAAWKQFTVQVDFGYGDTLLPPARWIDYACLLPDTSVHIKAVVPELQTAWKLHGLFECENWQERWRPKDLWDISLLSRHVNLDWEIFRKATETAFADRHTSLDMIQHLITGDFGSDASSEHRWRTFRREFRDPSMPEHPKSVVKQVGAFLKAVF